MPEPRPRQYRTYEEMEAAGLVNTPWESRPGAGWAVRRGLLGETERRSVTPEAWRRRHTEDVVGHYDPDQDVISYQGDYGPAPRTEAHERVHRGQEQLTNYPLPEPFVRGMPDKPAGARRMMLGGLDEAVERAPDLLERYPDLRDSFYYASATEGPAYRLTDHDPYPRATRDETLDDYLDAIRWNNPDESYQALEAYIPEQRMRDMLQQHGPTVPRPNVNMQEVPATVRGVARETLRRYPTELFSPLGLGAIR